MKNEEKKYIEKFAKYFELNGMKKTQAKILGFLLISKEVRQTLPNIAISLELSQSTISPELAFLVQRGLVNRIKKKDLPEIDDRRGFLFEISPSIWENTYDIEGKLTSYIIELAEEGIEILKNDTQLRKQRLIQMKEFLSFFKEELPILFEKYKKFQNEKLKS